MLRPTQYVPAMIVTAMTISACGPTPTSIPPSGSSEVAPATGESGAAPATPVASPPSQEAGSPQPIPLQVLLPLDGSQIDIEQCQVIGTTEPGAVVSVNEEIVIAGEDGAFQASLTLEPGANFIEVIASDSAGNEAFAYVTVTYQP